MGSSTVWVKPKVIKLVFAASHLKHKVVKSKSKDWLTQNQDNVSVLQHEYYIISELDVKQQLLTHSPGTTISYS